MKKRRSFKTLNKIIKAEEKCHMPEENQSLQCRIDMAENYIETQGKENAKLRAIIYSLREALRDIAYCKSFTVHHNPIILVEIALKALREAGEI